MGDLDLLNFVNGHSVNRLQVRHSIQLTHTTDDKSWTVKVQVVLHTHPYICMYFIIPVLFCSKRVRRCWEQRASSSKSWLCPLASPRSLVYAQSSLSYPARVIIVSCTVLNSNVIVLQCVDWPSMYVSIEIKSLLMSMPRLQAYLKYSFLSL